jgi:hypothetical protein
LETCTTRAWQIAASVTRRTPGSRDIEEYRRLVADAIYPDPFSKRRVSVRDAAAAIVSTDAQRGMHPGPSTSC